MAVFIMPSKEIRSTSTALAISLCQDSDSKLGIVVSSPDNLNNEIIDIISDLTLTLCDKILESALPIKLVMYCDTNIYTYIFGEALRLISDCSYFEEFQRLCAYEASCLLGISIAEE